MKHKRQPYVPASYLTAWCDPKTRRGQEPYVWLFTKSGEPVGRKAPKKIFVEAGFYTLRSVNGERDLVLEHGLSQLEGKFATLRQHKLDKRLPLTHSDRVYLCTFVAAMWARSRSRQDFLREQWQRLLDLGERMTEWTENASSEDVKRMSSAAGPLPRESDIALGMDDVRSIVEQPTQSLLGPEVSTVTPLLLQMRFGIVETPTSPGFITSDAPCVCFDAELLSDLPRFGAGGFVSPTIEVSLPLSPHQYVLFGYQLNVDGLYLPLKPDDPLVNEVNRRTCLFADRHVVVNESLTSPHWL